MTRQPLKRSTAPRRPRLHVTGYEGQWLALDPKTYKVLGHEATPEEAMRDISPKRAKRPYLFLVPESDAYFVGPAQ